MSNGTLFTRVPAWLRDALRVQEPDVPNVLGPTVDPVLDVGQGGWGDMEWKTDSVSAANNTQIVDVRAADKALGFLAFIDSDFVVAAGSCNAQLAAVDGVVGSDTRLVRVDSTVSQRVTWASFFGSPFVVIPPGFSLRVLASAVGVGNSCTVNVVSAAFRAGYKPI